VQVNTVTVVSNESHSNNITHIVEFKFGQNSIRDFCKRTVTFGIFVESYTFFALNLEPYINFNSVSLLTHLLSFCAGIRL